MNLKGYVSLWFNGITNAEKTVKKLEKGRVKSKEGMVSIGLFSFIIGIVSCLALIPFSKNAQATVMIAIFGLVFFPFLSIIGLAIFSAVLGFISNRMGGRVKIGRIMGLFGFIFPMIGIASIPAVLAIFLGALARNASVYMILLGIGVLITSAASGVVNALMLQALSGTQKTSFVKAGLVYGLTTGAIIAIIYILLGLFAGAMPAMTQPPMM